VGQSSFSPQQLLWCYVLDGSTCSPFGVSGLGVHKKLGGDTAGTADQNVLREQRGRNCKLDWKAKVVQEYMKYTYRDLHANRQQFALKSLSIHLNLSVSKQESILERLSDCADWSHMLKSNAAPQPRSDSRSCYRFSLSSHGSSPASLARSKHPVKWFHHP